MIKPIKVLFRRLVRNVAEDKFKGDFGCNAC